MQINAEQLGKHLQQPLKPLYLVFGDDDFLRAEAVAEIRRAAKQAGFLERTRLIQDQDFSWQQLQETGQTMSLFASQQLIELELPTAKPGTEGAKALQAYLENQNPDLCLIVFGPKLKADQTKTKWFKALTDTGVYVPIYSPDLSQLPRFIQRRAHNHGVQLANDAIQLLSQWYQGNLLALDQEVAKLALLHPDQVVGAQDIERESQEQSRFDVFSLETALLQQQADAFFHRLQRLLETDGEPAIIHWLLQRCQQNLASLLRLTEAGENFNQACKQLRIWQNQQSGYQAMLKAWNWQRNKRCLHLLERAELAFKRDSGEQLSVLFSHIGVLMLPKAHPRLGAIGFLHHHALADW